MKYILYDNTDGTILGLNDKEMDKYIQLTDETYDFILNNNGLYKVDLSKIDDSFDNTITKEMLISIINDNIEKQKENIISKNSELCSMFIKNGVTFTLNDGTKKKYLYSEYNQINIQELNDLINNNVIISTVPIKFNDDDHYSFISIDEFKKLYNQLLRNKYFHLFYLREYNDYIKTITDYNKLCRMNYETGLPEEKRNEIEEKLNNIFNNTGGDN